MTNWQIELITGIEDYFRKFEDTDEYVEEINIMRRPRVRREYDDTLMKLAEAKEAVSAFVGVYNEERELHSKFVL